MKIYLWNNNECDWKLYNSKDKGFDDEFKKRNIVISNYAKIGDSAKIGDYAKIGNSAKILRTPDNFSELNILLKTGVVMQNGEGIFYKAVRTDLCAFWNGGNYRYKVGKGDRCKNLKKEQSVECGEGWHFTSLWGAIAFLEKREGIIISARIRLKDILSVHKKVRVKAFSDVKIVKIDGLI